MKLLVMYIPVLHAGYERFLLKHRDASALFIFGKETISAFSSLKKDLRCLDPELTILSLRAWNIFPRIENVDSVSQEDLLNFSEIVMPDEVECHLYAERCLDGCNVLFDSVLLRYDKKRSEASYIASATMVNSEEAVLLMGFVIEESKRSPDWWLQVGALIARNGEVLLIAHNEHKPTDREVLFEGDPRSNFSKGVRVEITLADHAERVLIGEAARQGISLLDTDMYITTFPCATCAYQMVRAGIKRCFFKDGWVLMDASIKTFRQNGVEVFHVKTPD